MSLSEMRVGKVQKLHIVYKMILRNVLGHKSIICCS